MKKIKIFMADLTHTGVCIATENIPLNIGLIGSYALSRFGDSVEVRLFKYPDKLLSALESERPDILASSNYAWNSQLSEWACRRAKALYPDILTVQGGWNFPLDVEERVRFLKNRPATDIYVVHEGEYSFAAIVETFLESGREGVLSKVNMGCVYLDPKSKKTRLVEGPAAPRMQNLDEIPSPYLNHMLDEFFDGKLTPIIETARGCPFTCDFCNSAIDYYSKVRAFSDEYVLKDLDYIAAKVMEKGAGILLIADTNFGMYKRDRKIASRIAEMNEEIDWPRHVFTTTGKNRVERIFEAVHSLRKVLAPTLSLQSLNEETLKAIGRSNMQLMSYSQVVECATEQGLLPMCELIVPLPYETLETYWKGIESLIEVGNVRIISYTIQMNYGTVYREKNFMEKHGYKGQYRLVPNDYGIYGGELVFEPEMVATSSKYMSFQDYIQIRCFTFYMETMYNQLFEEFLKLAKEWGVSRYAFMANIRDNFDNAPEDLLKIRESFIRDTEFELKESEEALFDFYSNSENYEKLKRGEVGTNVVFKHKALALGDCHESLVEYVTDCMRLLLSKTDRANNPDCEKMIDSVSNYCFCKLHGFLSPESTDEKIYFEGAYNVKAWVQDKEGRSIENFKEPTRLLFVFSEQQKRYRSEIFSRYENSIPGKAKTPARVHVLESLFRTPNEVDELVSIS